MKYFYLLLTFLNISVCLGNYPLKTNNAEQLAIKGEFLKSADIYLETLDEYGHLTSADYYNLVVCLTKTNQNELAFRYIDSCIVTGYTKEPFQSEVFANLHQDELWNSFEKKYKSMRDMYLAHQKSETYQMLERMIETDQHAAMQMQESDGDNYKTDSVFYTNGMAIYQMIKQSKIPKVELFYFESIKMRSTIPWVLIRHYFGLVNRAKEFCAKNDTHKDFYSKVASDNRLYEALMELISKGRFAPNVLRDGLSYGSKNELYGKVGLEIIIKRKGDCLFGNCEIFEELWTINNYNDSMIQEYNIHREEIFLPSYEEQLAIATYWNAISDNIPEIKYGLRFRTIPANRIDLNDIDRIDIIKKETGYEVITRAPNKKGEMLEFKNFYPKEQVVKHIVND